MATINTSVANSEGWICNGPPSENHRWDPSAWEPSGDSTASRASTIPM